MTSHYSAIRFIGYAIPTTPAAMVAIGDPNGTGSVSGTYLGNSERTRMRWTATSSRSLEGCRRARARCLIVTSLSRWEKAREHLDEFLLFERLSKYGSVSISALYIGNAIAGDENERHPADS
jgi:hypothetical protein